MSIALLSVKRPNIAKATPHVPIVVMMTSPTWTQPVVMTSPDRMKIAKVMSVIGKQIFRASHIVRMNEALAMRADTAAVSEVGGDSSPHTDKKNTKKCATQGLMPSLTIGG